MADKINGFGRPGVNLHPTRGHAPAAADRSAGGGRSGSAPAVSDQVRITETATRLKRIEAGLAEVSDVDRSRVEAIRQKIEAGSYKVDPRRVALKLARFEQDLAG